MEVLFNHIKRKETDKEELPFPKKGWLNNKHFYDVQHAAETYCADC